MNMQVFLDFINKNIAIIVLSIFIFILFILHLSTLMKLKKLRKAYDTFIRKLGNGNNLDEMLHTYLYQVEEVEKKNNAFIEHCKGLEQNIAQCVQKIGMVRYNAFRDTGSDLSFSLALLNQYNNGIVLNGVYGRDNSNIYAKPVKDGLSSYMLSEEEKEAIRRAIEGE